METLDKLKTKRFLRIVFVRLMSVAILMGIFLIPNLNQDRVEAQTACRTASNLSASQIARAFARRIGVNSWQIRFEILPQHAMFCDADVFVICNRDKFAKKEELNVNVVNASAGGACNEFHQFNHVVNFTHFEYAVKIRFQENFFNGFPNGNPKRKVVKLVFDLGLYTASEGEEYEVTDLMVDLPDDGNDN